MKARLLRSSLLAALCAAPGLVSSAAAQQTPAPPAADQDAEERSVIVVTGTRIATPGYVSNSPIISIGEEELTEQQPVTVEQLLRTLPNAVPAIGTNVNNGSGGGATLDLRGLGSNRNLLLMDGRRLVPFNLTGSVDTNVIPLALIERVDLVSGGASAVYGADAITGVVNFILNHNFEGAQIAATYGISQEGDAARKRVEVTMGGDIADGRGNAVVSVGYTKTDPLYAGERPFGTTTVNSANGSLRGSTTTVPPRINTTVLAGGTAFPTSTDGWYINPTNGAIEAASNAQTFNTNPTNLMQTPLDRYQITGLTNYDITDWMSAYMDVLYVRSDVHTELASTGTFANTFDVPIGNPYIPTAARNQICAARNIAPANCVVGNATIVPLTIDRRFTEIGPRLNDFHTTTLQYTAGLKGDLPIENWTWDLYYSRGESDQKQVRGNWGSLSKLRQALNATSTTACTSTANGCVPVNPFGDVGSMTPAMLNFINLSAVLGQTVQQEVISATASGDLGEVIKSPFSPDRIGIAGGYEWRRVAAGNQSDGSSQTLGEVLGTGAPTPDRKGAYQLREFFAEASVPIVSDMYLINNLSIEAGVRHTEFFSAKDDKYNTWKAGIEYAPIDGLRFRTMWQKAVRAPTVNELFAPQVTGLSNLATDPCQGANISQAQANTAGTLSNLCLLTGVPLGVIGSLPAPSSGQVNNFSGGNPALGPEVAKTRTMGVVFQPSFVPNLTVTLDRYTIKITDAITTPSVNDIMVPCYTTNPSFTLNSSCALVGRNPITGTLNGVEAKGVTVALNNFGVFSTAGWDLGVSYSLDLADFGMDIGELDFQFNGTQLDKAVAQPTPTSIVRECAGYYSNSCATNYGQTNYDYKWSLSTGWSKGPFKAGLNWRHLSEQTEEPLDTVYLPLFSHVDAYDYFDLSGSWTVNDIVDLSLTVNNLLDEQPPFVGNTIGSTAQNFANTFPSNYDVLGRFFTFGARAKF